MRKRACIRVDLPLPVLPTIPVFMAPGKVNVRPFRTNGSCGAYLTCIKLKSYTSVLSRIIVFVFAKSLMLQLAFPSDWILLKSQLTYNGKDMNFCRTWYNTEKGK
jgi:hypothetical protein